MTPSEVKEPRLQRTEPNAGTGDPTDGRDPYQWKSQYEPQAKKEIRLESFYLASILAFSFGSIFFIWNGGDRVCRFLSINIEEIQTFKKYAYYTTSGMLGGVTFGIKYFYRVVARGYWHQDRRIWRMKLPFLSMVIAFATGAMIDASMITTHKPTSGAAVISIGFLSGYFADQAVGKMYEIANVIFGKSASTKSGDGH